MKNALVNIAACCRDAEKHLIQLDAWLQTLNIVLDSIENSYLPTLMEGPKAAQDIAKRFPDDSLYLIHEGMVNCQLCLAEAIERQANALLDEGVTV